MKTIALILAAGRENQMRSERAKELHQLLGKSMLDTTAETLRPLAERTIVVLGHHAQELSPALPDWCQSCVQDFTLGLGTAKAVMAALPMIEADTRVLITSGDKPCISQESYQHLLDAVDGTTYCAAVLYADRRDPEGYDRVIFDGDGDVKRIAHRAELLPPEEDIPSVNACVYCFSGKALRQALPDMRPNAQRIYHISDLIGQLAEVGQRIAAVQAEQPQEAKLIVNRADLAEATAFIVRRHCEALMRSGVTLLDPAHTYVEGDVTVGQDTVIYPGCVLQRGTTIGARCVLYPGCRLARTTVGNDAVLEQVVAEDSTIASGAHVGPFVYLQGKNC